MLRRTQLSSNIWTRYRFPHTAVPKLDGPPPMDSPREMNRSKKYPNVDPINDPFPRAIRGDRATPDVPELTNYISQWYVLNNAPMSGPRMDNELMPWTALAPTEDAFRFRPFSEFNSLGREMVKSLRVDERLRNPDGSYKSDSALSGAASERGAQTLPSREEYLTRMNPANVSHEGKTLSSLPSPCTVMDRALKERYRGIRHQTPLQKQHDVGRTEAVPRIAGTAPVDKTRFPFNWKTEDWYEYEVSRVRLQRFQFENAPAAAGAGVGESSSGGFSSEVTYKIILGMTWEHHVDPLADDVSAFIREVGRQVIEEKLVSVRASLQSVRTAPIDPELRAAYNRTAANVSSSSAPSVSSSSFVASLQSPVYSDDEIRMQMQRELEQLEAECVRTLGLINVSTNFAASQHDYRANKQRRSDPSSTWPVVEDMEPWRRMFEFWGQRADNTFGQSEASTRKYELRRFFRCVRIKLPFQSTEFEKRVYDIRHWAHQGASVEFQTIYKKNVVHDQDFFPVEHDPAERHTHEHHRMFSFALDWQTAPVNFVATTEVLVAAGGEAETVAGVAQRLGCSVESLVATNSAVFGAGGGGGGVGAGSLKLKTGTILNVPADATKRLTSTSVSPKRINLSAVPTAGDGKNNSSKHGWDSVAAFLNCTVPELKAANGPALLTYDDANSCFPDSVTSLQVPSSVLVATAADAFSDIEQTFVSDTFEDIAARLGCSVADLKAANPDIATEAELAKATQMKVPASARTPRRRTEPLLRNPTLSGSNNNNSSAGGNNNNETFTKLSGEIEQHRIPSEIPAEPENAAHNFPGEFRDSAGQYPHNPRMLAGMEDWLAYTATYLDKDLSVRAAPRPLYNENRVWPAQAVPGSMQQEPFSEDQTWLLHRIPVHTHEVSNPDQDPIQGLENVNHEQYPQSLEWRAP